MKTIEITVSPNGQTSVETKGFSGAECRQASHFIETAVLLKGSEVLPADTDSRSLRAASGANLNKFFPVAHFLLLVVTLR